MRLPLPTITVVTPSYNQGEFLEATLESVLSQGYQNLEYIVIDGGSSDHSVEIIQRYAKHLAYWVSEPDRGQYHALNKGFARSQGKYMTWINSDDMLKPRSLRTVGEILTEYPQVEWLTGTKMFYSCDATIESVQPPHPYRASLIRNGFNQGALAGWLQQEGTFWSRRLWRSGGPLREDLHYASDFLLWTRFAAMADLYSVNVVLAGNRHQPAQKTFDGASGYLAEVGSNVPLLTRLIGNSRLLSGISRRTFRWLPLTNQIYYNSRANRWELDQ